MMSSFLPFVLYTGFILSGLMLVLMTLGLILDILFLFFPKVECEIENYSIYPRFPQESEKDIQSYNLRINYKYKIDDNVFKSKKINHFNSFERNSIVKVEESINKLVNSQNKVFAYVCPFMNSYSIIFPLRFSYVINGIAFLFFLFSFIIFGYFIYA